MRPVIKYVSNQMQGRAVTLLDVGCGIGIVTAELGKLCRITGDALDVDCGAVDAARRVRTRFPDVMGGVQFHCGDMAAVLPHLTTYDCITLIDVLEHIERPDALLDDLIPLLRANAVILVSVPTPRYRGVFGAGFHNEVGHLVDGYDLETLKVLFRACELEQYSYNTGLIASFACRLFYRRLRNLRNRVIRYAALATLVATAANLDFVNGPAHSCSLFAVFRPRQG